MPYIPGLESDKDHSIFLSSEGELYEHLESILGDPVGSFGEDRSIVEVKLMPSRLIDTIYWRDENYRSCLSNYNLRFGLEDSMYIIEVYHPKKE